MSRVQLLTCLCCDAPVINVRGAYEVCPICGWEDDPVQAKDPDFTGGANRMSLSQARSDWRARQGSAD